MRPLRTSVNFARQGRNPLMPLPCAMIVRMANFKIKTTLLQHFVSRVLRARLHLLLYLHASHAQQANSSHAPGAPTRTMERRRCLSQTSEDSSRRRLARGRMTAFLSPSGNWQHGHGSTDAVPFRRRCRIDAESPCYVKACHNHEVGQPRLALLRRR